MSIAPRSPGIEPPAEIAFGLRATFAQPTEQALPQDFLAMLVALDRAKRVDR